MCSIFLYNFHPRNFSFDEHSGLHPRHAEKHMHIFTQGVHHICPILPKLEHVRKISKMAGIKYDETWFSSSRVNISVKS